MGVEYQPLIFRLLHYTEIVHNWGNYSFPSVKDCLLNAVC